MNSYLRSVSNSPAPINDIISKLTPLEKDIIVYRYINAKDFIPSVPGIFINHGICQLQ
jgi:hypothetical protein